MGCSLHLAPIVQRFCRKDPITLYCSCCGFGELHYNQSNCCAMFLIQNFSPVWGAPSTIWLVAYTPIISCQTFDTFSNRLSLPNPCMRWLNVLAPFSICVISWQRWKGEWDFFKNNNDWFGTFNWVLVFPFSTCWTSSTWRSGDQHIAMYALHIAMTLAVGCWQLRSRWWWSSSWSWWSSLRSRWWFEDALDCCPVWVTSEVNLVEGKGGKILSLSSQYSKYFHHNHNAQNTSIEMAQKYFWNYFHQWPQTLESSI